MCYHCKLPLGPGRAGRLYCSTKCRALAEKKRYRRRHREQIAEGQRRYRAEHPDWYEEQKLYMRTYMAERRQDPEYRAAGNAASYQRSQKNRQFIRDLKNKPCMDCGKKYPPEVMEFDHRDGSEKVFEIASATRLGRFRILEEAAKCDLVCANCHRLRTLFRRNRTDSP